MDNRQSNNVSAGKFTSLNSATTKQAANAILLWHGWKPVPVPAREKGPTIKSWQDLRLTEEEIDSHFGPGLDVGVLTGRASNGLIDLDLDCPEARLVGEMLLPSTLMSGRPGSRRSHYWFMADGEQMPPTLKFEDMSAKMVIELRADRHQTVIPPSSHPSGEKRIWENDCEPTRLSADQLVMLAREVATASILRRFWNEKGRHNLAVAAAGFLSRRIQKERARKIIEAAAGTEDEELNDRLRAVEDTYEKLSAGEPIAGGPTLDQIVPGLGQRLAQWWGDKKDHNQLFGGKHFLPNVLAEQLLKKWKFLTAPIDSSGRGVRLYVYRDGVYSQGGESFARSEIHKALGNQSKPDRIDAVIACLKESTKQAEHELNPYALDLICARNGMVNWRTGELSPHDPKYLCTFKINADFDPRAEDPIVAKFLSDVFPADALALAGELLGYLIRPVTHHQKAFMLCGSGANGKSSFLSLTIALLGDENVSRVAIQDFSESRFRTADLHGKLANINPDLPARGLQQTDVFKSIVCGEPVVVERKNGHPFDLKPTARLLFGANELPKSKDLTNAYFRRWLVIPFVNKFEGAKADRSIIAKLTTPVALSTVFNYAIAGLKRLEDQQAFTDCPSVTEAGRQYRLMCDNVLTFTSRFIDTNDREAEVEKSVAYKRYVTWAVDMGIRFPASQPAFNKHMSEALGLVERRSKTGRARVWAGASLREDEAPEAASDGVKSQPDPNNPGDFFFAELLPGEGGGGEKGEDGKIPGIAGTNLGSNGAPEATQSLSLEDSTTIVEAWTK